MAKTAPGIKCNTTADAGDNWYFLGFEGEIEGEKLQAIDQVHLNKDGRIDQVIIYMRPIPVAQKFAEAIMQRLQTQLPIGVADIELAGDEVHPLWSICDQSVTPVRRQPPGQPHISSKARNS